MADFIVSNQVSKILSRYNKSPSPYSPEKPNLDSSGDSPLINQSSFSKESSSSYQNLKFQYQISVLKYSTPSLRSLTPNTASKNLIAEPQDSSLSSSPAKSSTPTKDKNQSFQPTLNKNSIKIASKLGSSRERLMSQTPVQKVILEEEYYSYKPEINKKSRKISRKQNEHEQRWNTLYSRGREKKKELERIRSEIEIREKKMEDFAFTPAILDSNLKADPSKTVERLASWAKSKEQKIREKKESEMDRDMKECTFAPKLTQQQQSKEELKMVKGVSKYLERGLKIKSDNSQEIVAKNSPVKDMDRKRYNDLVQMLHEELLSLDL